MFIFLEIFEVSSFLFSESDLKHLQSVFFNTFIIKYELKDVFLLPFVRGGSFAFTIFTESCFARVFNLFMSSGLTNKQQKGELFTNRKETTISSFQS